MSPYQTLAVRKEGAVDWVTFNRPESLNALNPKMVDELLDYFGKAYWDKATRIVVLKGSGRAYCAGLDLKERGGNENDTRSAGAGLTSQRRISEIVMRMRRCPQGPSRSCTARRAAAALRWRWPATSASRVRARG